MLEFLLEFLLEFEYLLVFESVSHLEYLLVILLVLSLVFEFGLEFRLELMFVLMLPLVLELGKLRLKSEQQTCYPQMAHIQNKFHTHYQLKIQKTRFVVLNLLYYHLHLRIWRNILVHHICHLKLLCILFVPLI
jgi:hypothetical protein